MTKILNEIFEIEDFCNQYERMLIFGAGRTCYSLLLYMIKCDFDLSHIFCIAVSNPEYNLDSIFGIPVCLIDDIETDDIDAVLITTFENRQENVIELLYERGFNNCYTICNALYAKLRQTTRTLSVEILTNTQWVRDDIRAFSAKARRQVDSIVGEEKKTRADLLSVSRESRETLLKVINNIDNLVNSNHRVLFATEASIMRELQWRDNFRMAVDECKWIEKKDFVPGGFAVGSYYLYIMLKIFEKKHPKSILDIGMGQTSKLISQYVKNVEDSYCTIVEGDRDWIDFFKGEMIVSDKVTIEQMDCIVMEDENDNVIRRYAGFLDRLEGKKFDLISIDGPFGGDMKEHSRIDILDILPSCLLDSWVIMLDDVQREGELNTFNRIMEVLDDSDIKFHSKIHYGEKAFGIMTSEDNRFFCTV